MEVDKTKEVVDLSNIEEEKADVVARKSLCTQKSKNFDDLVESSETFKKPVLIIGSRKSHPVQLKTLSQCSVATEFMDSEYQSNDNSKHEHKSEMLNSTVKCLNDSKVSFDYLEPTWSSVPEGTYKMEVLKSGMIIEIIDLSSKSYHVIGRLPSCDISMAHPTISRFHAILQYRGTGDGQSERGMYIYDLGSTHGTFWNGCRIKQKVYVRLQGGHMIRFGCSQRKFILQAPSDDQEPESEFSVSQLKEMRKRELEEHEKLIKQQEIEEKEEPEGIDWGMGEDADEETDLIENPYAQTNNEELFLSDPKKTLRGWFEREGCDLQYQTEDKGIGRFLCWVDLPLDNTLGKSVRAEAFVTGKKKEAVLQCALEACRILDRYGLLRQANHEARKRKIRNWEEEDYYDSDEDNFLDRTGVIEKKREQRMRMAGKLETKADTYDSLLEKHVKIVEEIKKIENTLALQKSKQEETDNLNEDALDAFMSTLNSSMLDKIAIRKMKMDLINLRKEEMHLLKLLNIAKPFNLPPLKPATITVKNNNDFKNMQSNCSKTLNLSLSQESVTMVKSKNNSDDREDLINEEKDLKEVHNNTNENEEDAIPDTNKRFYSKKESLHLETANSCKIKNNFEKEEGSEKDHIKKKKNINKNKEKFEKNMKAFEDEFRKDYSMWVPPENQSGDGKTILNEKFGY